MQQQNILIEEIIKILPHQYPILLVDRVTMIKPSEEIIGLKNVTFNEPYFTGHFPNQPIMPGVMIVEALAQLAAILVAKTLNLPNNNNKQIYLLSIEEAKFRKIVIPGDVLILQANIIQNRADSYWKFICKAEVDGELACTAKITAMVKDKDK